MENCCLETKCILCCKQTNMLLSYRDIERIEALGYAHDFFIKKRCGWLQLKNKNGRCVFHNGAGCTIYENRPEGCTLYPVVYDADAKSAILDAECPQKKCFSVSKEKTGQLIALVSALEHERMQRAMK